jgi:CsbD-like
MSLWKQFGAIGPQTSGGSSMNKEHVSGKAEEIKGKVKEKVGHATDDPDTEAAGLKGSG